jgi:hypothetical protein
MPLAAGSTPDLIPVTVPESEGTTLKPERLRRHLREAGGFTLHPETGEQPSTGYAVCADRRLSRRIAWDAWDDHHVGGWLRNLVPDLEQGSHFLGGWLEPDGKRAWLEVVVVVPAQDRRRALRLASRARQQAVYDLGNAAVVHVASADMRLEGGHR